jgi:hypothetical protein
VKEKPTVLSPFSGVSFRPLLYGDKDALVHFFIHSSNCNNKKANSGNILKPLRITYQIKRDMLPFNIESSSSGVHTGKGGFSNLSGSVF